MDGPGPQPEGTAQSQEGLRDLCAQSAAKLEAARRLVGELRSAVVAFSGGADSALVLRLARDALGERAVALTAVSPSLATSERVAAERFCRDLGVRHVLVESREIEDPLYAANGEDRCYHCKSELYSLCDREAARLGLAAVLDGFNADDMHAHRPGRKAALEHRTVSPLAEAGLRKDEVRAHSWALGLTTWDKPAMPCLASRLPFGTLVTVERLAQVGGAEECLRALGFRTFRVRHHGEVARIEIGAGELGRLLDPRVRRDVTSQVKACGFRFVAVDLEPFESGRLSAISPGMTVERG